MSTEYTFYTAYGYALTLEYDRQALKKILKTYEKENSVRSYPIFKVKELLDWGLDESRNIYEKFDLLDFSHCIDRVSGTTQVEAIIISPKNAVFYADKWSPWRLNAFPKEFDQNTLDQLEEFKNRFGIVQELRHLFWTNTF
jgi:hypothetical protein